VRSPADRPLRGRSPMRCGRFTPLMRRPERSDDRDKWLPRFRRATAGSRPRSLSARSAASRGRART
jgi:hypothetical protein